MKQIQRHKIVEGRTIAGIIRNVQYFYVDIDVYADGMIGAWDLNDLNQFAARFRGGRLRILTSVPDGQVLSVFGLGAFKVISGRWRHTPETYFGLVMDTLKVINPELTNIYSVTKHETELRESRRFGSSAKAEPYRLLGRFGNFKESGKSTKVFMNHEERNLLVDISVFKSGNVEISHPEMSLAMTMEELGILWKEGKFFTSLDGPMEIFCAELGVLTLVNSGSCLDIASKWAEIETEYEKQQERSRFRECQNAYLQYLKSPSEVHREKLRIAYEKVPSHQRIYLADMDNKDWDYRRILYTDQKREV